MDIESAKPVTGREVLELLKTLIQKSETTNVGTECYERNVIDRDSLISEIDKLLEPEPIKPDFDYFLCLNCQGHGKIKSIHPDNMKPVTCWGCGGPGYFALEDLINDPRENYKTIKTIAKQRGIKSILFSTWSDVLQELIKVENDRSKNTGR